MSPKPHRLLLDRVAGVADEASGFLRRRRAAQQPFARASYAAGRSAAFPAETPEGRELFLAAARLIDIARAE